LLKAIEKAIKVTLFVEAKAGEKAIRSQYEIYEYLKEKHSK
jgi:hypothetical protein